MNEIFEAEDKVNAIHPVFVIPWAAVAKTYKHFGSKVGF